MSSTPKWVNDYIGIPFDEKGSTHEGCSCWGLVHLVYKEQFGIHVPTYVDDYKSVADWKRLTELISKHGVLPIWHEIAVPACGDVVLLRIRNRPIHVGIYVEESFMLHIDPDVTACIDRLNAIMWRNRILGYYRHQELLTDAA